MRGKKPLFLLPFFLIFLLLVGPVYSLTRTECEELEKQDISKGIECWEKLLGETSKQKKTLEDEVSRFNNQIALTTAEINRARFQVQQLEEEINQLGQRIGLLDYSLNSLSTLLLKRISQTYKQSRVDPLMMLLSSQDFAQFLGRMKYYRVAQLHDRNLLLKLETSRLNYQEQKELKESKQFELENLRKVLEGKQNSLAQQKKEKEYILGVTENNERLFQELLSKARAEKEALEKVMRESVAALKDGVQINKGEIIAVMGNTGYPCCSTAVHLHFEVRKDGQPQNPADYLQSTSVVWDNSPDGSFSFQGSWPWPIEGARITQGYGMTYWSRLGWYNNGPHTGIDMVSDAPAIRAPEGGTLYKGSTSCGGGCPIKFVAIDHGNNLVSWYWHVE